MTKPQTPNRLPVERLQLDVSETRPLRVFNSLYESIGNTTRFDMHYELEFGVVLQGRCRRFREQQQGDLRPGDAWFCGMWQTHGIEILKAPCRLLVVVLWPPLLADLRIPELPQHNGLRRFAMEAPLALTSATPSVRREILHVALTVAALGNEPPDAIARYRLRMRVLDLLLLLDQVAGGVKTSAMVAAGGGVRLHDINPALERVFASRRSVRNDDAARCCGMNTFRFIRQFAALMGISFAQFALRHRLRGAAILLRDSDLPVKAVAQEWGFTDESHLHRLFRRHYNCTPRGYRTGQ